MNSFQLFKRTLIVSVLFVFSNAFADKGVFNAKATPDEFFTNTPTTVTVSAEIGAENLYISSIAAYQTTADGKPITKLGQMYDDGTHGDARAADTIFTMQLSINRPIRESIFVRVTAAYRSDRNRYLSPVMQINTYDQISAAEIQNFESGLKSIKDAFLQRLSAMNIEAAREQAYLDAKQNPNISEVNLSGVYLSIVFKNGVRGTVTLVSPNTTIDSLGNSVPSTLPNSYKNPGNDKLLIFASGYSDASPQNQIADYAKSRFDQSEYMFFNPKPSTITKDTNASLEVIKQWGDYGTVITHTHGAVWASNSGSQEVVIQSGTLTTAANTQAYNIDLTTGRIGISTANKFNIYPSFISKHASSMKNTFFYLGSCDSLANDTLWDALKAKGAKVAFGWSDTVDRGFNSDKLKELIDPMLPIDSATNLFTAKEAYDSISDKVDGWCLFNNVCLFGTGATLTKKTASPEWENFIFYEGGIVNGDFETADWTGWTHGGDYNFRLISGATKHQGNVSAALGRWDTAFHGADSTAEPFGYEWFYQDFVVPQNTTYLKFYWWMETYDTAIWDWFDASIKDTNGNTLQIILNHAGKPGSDYGPYWTTSGWQEVKVDIAAYRGQKIRIYFDQRLDGYGDQQRVYVDDVTLEQE